MARTYRLGAFRRTVNRLMVVLVRAGTGPADTWLMTVTGRKSGQPRTTPVTLVTVQDERWLVAPYGPVPWVHNVRSAKVVTLRRGKQTTEMTTAELDPTNPDEAALAGEVLAAYVREVRITAPFFDAERNGPVSNFVAEADQHPVFRLVTPG